MTTEKLENLKRLINTSPILNVSERAEWLALLDLMNDKQLLELEKILNSNQKPADQLISKSVNQPASTAGGKISKSANQQVSQSVSRQDIGEKKQDPRFKIQEADGSASIKASPMMAQLPKLSHIMNLPNLEHSAFGMQRVAPPSEQKNALLDNTASQIESTQQPAKTSVALTKKPSIFAAKLKAIFGEKELPSGQKNPQLDLSQAPAVPVPSSSLPPKPIVLNSPAVVQIFEPQSVKFASSEPETLTSQKPVVSPTQVVKTPPPPKIQEKTLVKKPTFVEAKPILKQPAMSEISELLKKVSSQATESKTSLSPEENITKDASAGKAARDFLPGINFPVQSDNTTQRILSSIEEHKLMAKAVSEPKISKTEMVAVNLNSLQDLTGMDSEILQKNDFDYFVKKIKDLVYKLGYHDVLFNLEKSNLYQSYIRTGIEILNKQSDFEQLADSDQATKFLTRHQFEEVADLLRMIQTG